MDEELLPEFLEEATDLFESLNENLVSLESDTSNKEILNEIFRAFHTIKGGAGFLELKAMVDLCHRSEDIFDQIRSGKRGFNSDYMDVFSKVLDELSGMFEQIRDGEYALKHPTTLIDELDGLLDGDSVNDSFSDSKAIDLTEDIPGLSGEVGEMDEMEAFFESIKQAPQVELPEDTSDSPVEAIPDAKSENINSVVTNEKSIVESPSSKKSKKAESAVVRVDTAKIDDIVNLVGELVLNRNRLKQVAQHLESPELIRGIGALDYITTELQSSVMKTRMQPVKKVFQRFPRIVRDVARNLSKEVEMFMFGEDTELDKNLVDALADPLIHMVRNSVDHGVEEPNVRVKKGKSRVGLITLKAEQLGDHIEITISDDGKGIDPSIMRNKAVEKGLLEKEEADALSDLEALQLIFSPGFSTAEQITDISGRGVGMDVVKTTVERLNGFVSIDSKLGFGSTFTLKIPLTMAILQTLMVEIGDHEYAIPLPGISEIFIYDQNKVNVIDGQSLSRLREGSVPIFYLEELLPPKYSKDFDSNNKKVVVVKLADKLAGIVVDNVLGQEEVVIKPLGAFLSSMNEYAGATITGNGKVALILDVHKLLVV